MFNAFCIIVYRNFCYVVYKLNKARQKVSDFLRLAPIGRICFEF